MPWMWLVAGPNGSGKSTLVSAERISRLPGSPLVKFNSDDLSQELRKKNSAISQSEADLCAVRTNDAEIANAIEQGRSFLTETVLSTDKYIGLVKRAKELGFSIGLLFVTLRSPEHNIERVKLRVKLGGHNVLTDKIVSRWEKSLSNLSWFVGNADIALIYDNSKVGDKGPELIASKELNASLQLLKPGINPRIDRELKPLLAKA